MKIARHFTVAGENPLKNIKFHKVNSRITSPNGDVIFEQNDVEVPEHWDDIAVNILAQKYFRKTGVPLQTLPLKEEGVPEWISINIPCNCAETGGEWSALQVFRRLVGCWTYWGWKGKYFDDEEDANTYYDEMIYMLAMQIGAPNSPQFFNTGLYWAYGIEGQENGSYYVDDISKELISSTNTYEHPQTSACFIQPVEDELVTEGGIMDLWLREARIFKGGSGSGTNFSNIRGKGEPLSGGGISSGLMSFLKIGDQTSGSIKSGGTTRRSSKMVVLDVDHPDIEEFIEWKPKEEQKVRALVEGSKLLKELDPSIQELTYDWTGEAYATVSGQNSNNSISVTTAFMEAVVTDKWWDLKGRVNGLVKTRKAKDLWDKICKAAWQSADPGLQFNDTMNDWHTVPNGGKINATNPCSEFVFLDNTACNLASLNLLKFYDLNNDIIKILDYRYAIQLWTFTLELSVYGSQFPSKEIALNSYNYRPLGLGYANLGGLLMTMGIPYDSDEARTICANLTSIMTAEAYSVSGIIARKAGSFSKFADNREQMLSVIRKHSSYVDKNCASVKYKYLFDTSKSLWKQAEEIGTVYGYRNAQVTVIAPTGTIGLLMGCDTTGIEPDFALVKNKQLAGGGNLQIINRSVESALKKLGYDGAESDSILIWLKTHGNLKGAGLEEKYLSVFHCANEISVGGHLNMMAAAQPFLSGAISKTINLPNEASEKDISDAYMQSWKLGLKAIAIYRDGSKLSQPLNGKKKNEPTPIDSDTGTNSTISTMDLIGNRRKLPNYRRGHTQKGSIGGHNIYLHTGEYSDGSLGEIFLDISREGTTLNSLMNNFAIAVSLGLQHGVPLQKFVDAFTFTKFEPAGFVQGHDKIKSSTSYLDYVFRHLAIEYLKRSELAHVKGDNVIDFPTEKIDKEIMGYSGDSCPSCSNFTMVRNGTCLVCKSCGDTSGCS